MKKMTREERFRHEQMGTAQVGSIFDYPRDLGWEWRTYADETNEQNEREERNEMEKLNYEQLRKVLKVGMKIQTNYDCDDPGIIGEVSCIHEDRFFLTNVRDAGNGKFRGGGSCHQHNVPGHSWHIGDGDHAWFIIQNESKEELICKTQYQPGASISGFVEQLISEEKNEDRLKWLKTFQRCVLPPNVKSAIEEAITTVLLKSKFEEWGINDTFEKGLTNAILLYGPPGTGKTMIAESIAAVIGQNLYKATVADLQSQIPGQMEKNVTKAFERAKQTNAVLMFDECDSLLYNRDAVGAIMAAEINHLLTEIERFDGVIVLTTNRLGRLDPALQRRIISRVELEIPGKKERAQIWKNLTPNKLPLEEDIDFEALATHELAGGDIKNAILIAARKAIAQNLKKVSQELFQAGVAATLKAKEDFSSKRPRPLADVSYPSFGKVMGMS